MSKHPLVSPAPPEVWALLDDPRLAGMVRRNECRDFRVLDPATLPTHLSSHLFLQPPKEFKHPTEWINPPELDVFMGAGLGFNHMAERPRILQHSGQPKDFPKLLQYGQWFLASPEVIELLSAHDQECLEVCEVDWLFNDGTCLEGYMFIDVTLLLYAYDYTRSRVRVDVADVENECVPRGRHVHISGPPAVLKDELPVNGLLFRDAFDRSPILIARQLAEQLLWVAGENVHFNDPHTGNKVELKPQPVALAKGLPHARSLSRPSLPTSTASWEAGDRFVREVVPLLDRQCYREAEAHLLGWLKGVGRTPFHRIGKLKISDSSREVAAFLDEFFVEALARGPVAAIHVQMNLFTLNTDRWFCRFYALSEDGGREDYDWLEYHTHESSKLWVISGLEPIQAAFDSDDAGGDAAELAEWIVIIKLKSRLQQALPLMKHMNVPLLASVYEINESTSEIGPRMPK